MLRLSDLNLDELPEFGFEEEEPSSSEESNNREIAIIGMALRMPLADTLRAYWENIRNGVDCTRRFPEERKAFADAFLERMGLNAQEGIAYLDGGYVDGIQEFDAKFFKMTPGEANLMSPEQRLFLECAWEALEDAGYGGSRAVGSRTGVFAGHIGDLGGFNYRQLIDELEIDPALRPASVPGNLASIISSRISYLLDLKGPAMLIDTACSSSLVAVHQACLALRNGDCEMALAGGIRLNLIPVDKPEDRVGMESSDGKTRTFDQTSDGTAMGEGVGVVLLKPLAQAQQDGDPIYAVVKGTAINQDGLSAGITFPNGQAQTDVLLRAWKDADIDPSTIGLIEAHGTGTKIGDPIELDGLTAAFERFTEQKQFVAIGSVKSNIGHSYQSAGVAGLIKAVLALRHRELPPSLHFQEPNRRVKFTDTPFYVNSRLRRWTGGTTPRRCGISSFGFSGTNAHAVLEEAPTVERERAMESGNPQMLVLSATSPNSLRELVERYLEFLPETDASWEEICYSAGVGRGHFSHRIAVVARDKSEALSRLKSWEFADAEKNSVPDTELAQSVKHYLYEWQAEGYENAEVLQALADLYMSGAHLEFSRLYPRKRFQFVHLPTTPFDRKTCWLPTPTARTARKNVDLRPTSDNPRPTALTLQPVKLEGREAGSYTDVERKLAGVIRHVLGVEEINIHDSLYELGGNSILLQAIHGHLQTLFPHQVLLTDLFAHPSISQLAHFLSDTSSPKDEPDLHHLLDEIQNGSLTIDQALEFLKGGSSWNSF
ncbi:hypothetical protein JJB07_20920 [Tumebacillus sp. ITR2]|uniref:Carrier domain-containing protein n=1 Tax=Tumebacillus amylolyticus TaxID=2801339 RepID=A0ABS1JGD0_9BACL|nr:polyketide synthase [Tumebacillus amylolyticus]MBL0389059.1 hypothetical protein [Tumebacillus amylolyticus]